MKSDLSRYGVFTLLLLLCVSCSSKETKTADGSLAGLLPAKSELAGFTRVSKPVQIDRNNGWDRLGANGDKLLYNGFQQLATAQYTAPDESRRLTLDLLQFQDEVRAFAIFTFLRRPGAKPVDLQPTGYLASDTLLFVKGTYLGRFVSSYANAESDLIQAAKVTLGKIADSAELPIQLQYFPREGMIPHSETVTLDDVGGHNQRSELFGAKYLLGNDTAALYIRLNPEGGPAVVVEEFIGKEGQIKDYLLDAGYQVMVGQDETGRLVYCAVDEGLLCTVVGAIDRKLAEQLVAQTFAIASKLGKR
jgi:hypothetical protein